MLTLKKIHTQFKGKPHIMFGIAKQSDGYIIKELLSEDIGHLKKQGFDIYQSTSNIPQQLLKQVLL